MKTSNRTSEILTQYIGQEPPSHIKSHETNQSHTRTAAAQKPLYYVITMWPIHILAHKIRPRSDWRCLGSHFNTLV